MVYKYNDMWYMVRQHLETNKEVFNSELYALGMAMREIQLKVRSREYTEVELRCDAQAALKRIKDNRAGLLSGSYKHGKNLRDEKVSLFDSGRRSSSLRLRSVLRALQLYPKALSSEAPAVAEP